MNVPTEQVVALAHALGVSKDLTAEGVVRSAVERLAAPREYHLEVREKNGHWSFHSFHNTYAAAQQLRASLRERWESDFRIIELLRRVLP